MGHFHHSFSSVCLDLIRSPASNTNSDAPKVSLEDYGHRCLIHFAICVGIELIYQGNNPNIMTRALCFDYSILLSGRIVVPIYTLFQCLGTNAVSI